MSTILKINNGSTVNLISFEDYCVLSESISPTRTEFGLDGRDGRFGENDTHYWTFFSLNDKFHVLVHLGKNGTFGFGTHKGEFTDDVLDHYDESPKHSGDALSVFNKAIYVCLVAGIKFNIKKISFHGANPELRRVYNIALKSKYLHSALEVFGYHYDSTFRDIHTFIRF